jgi:hypothetical protein
MASYASGGAVRNGLQANGSKSGRTAPQQTPPSGLEFVSELSDLAVGAGMLVFTFAPLALPALALTTIAAVALLIPALVGIVLAAPIVAVRRWRRAAAPSRALPRDSEASRSEGEA